MHRLLITALACLISVSVFGQDPNGQEIIATDSLFKDSVSNTYNPKTHENAILVKWTGSGVASIGAIMYRKEETRELGNALIIVGGVSSLISSLVQDIQAIRHGKEFKPFEDKYDNSTDRDKSSLDNSLYNHGKIYGLSNEPKLFKILEFANIDGEKLMLISFVRDRYFLDEEWIGYDDYEIEWIDQAMHNKAFKYFSTD